MATRDRPSIGLSIATSAIAPATAAIFTNPADVAKTRLNMARELQPPGATSIGVLETLKSIWHMEGISGLQRGLGFVLIRESTKNAFRIGLFEPIVGMLERGNEGPPAMASRVATGFITGGLSSFICNPLDLLKTRLQLDPSRGAGATATAAFQQLVATEGVLGLWRRGVFANVARSSVATSLGLPVNYQLKDVANRSQIPLFDRWPMLRDATCALAASAVVVIAINPVDLVRTRLFSQPAEDGAAGRTKVKYRGVLDCCARVAATEGVQGFFKGTVASFLRVGPHQMLTFVLIGSMQRLATRRDP